MGVRSSLSRIGAILSRPLLRGISAVDNEFRARHELGFIGGEVNDAVGDIVRLADMAEGTHRIDFYAASRSLSLSIS